MIFSTQTVTPIVGREVTVATIAGPLDKVDAFVQGGVWPAGLTFYLYATSGSVRARAAQAVYQGPGPGRLQWQTLGSVPTSDGSAHAGGSSYDLVVYANAGQAPTLGVPLAAPTAITATLAGADDGDAVSAVAASGVQVLTAAEVTIMTAAGPMAAADVGVDMTALPPVILRLYASCGPGSVQGLVAQATTGGPDAQALVLSDIPLPAATLFTLTAQPVASRDAGASCTASLATSAPGASLPVTITGTTLNAATTTIDTGISVPDAHAAKVDLAINAFNPAVPATNSRNGNASLRAAGGVLTIAGAPIISGASGDASLATATVSLAVSGHNTLQVVLTPPGGYAAGTIDWVVVVDVLLNPPL